MCVFNITKFVLPQLKHAALPQHTFWLNIVYFIVGVCVGVCGCIPPFKSIFHPLSCLIREFNFSTQTHRSSSLPIWVLLAGSSHQGSFTTRQACVDNSSRYTSNLYCKGSCSETIQTVSSNKCDIKVTGKWLFSFFLLINFVVCEIQAATWFDVFEFIYCL